MSFCFFVTENDLNNLRKLAEQQKKQRAVKTKNRNVKQTHDIKLAESLSPTTKKLEEVVKTAKKLGEVIDLKNHYLKMVYLNKPLNTHNHINRSKIMKV